MEGIKIEHVRMSHHLTVLPFFVCVCFWWGKGWSEMWKEGRREFSQINDVDRMDGSYFFGKVV